MHSTQTFSMAIEIFGVIVQIAILALLIVKRLAHKFPALTATMVFFIVRSALTYSVQHYTTYMLSKVPRATWVNIFQGINIAEDVLQAAIVIELLLWLVPALSAWRRRIWWQLATGAVIAIGFVATTLHYLGYSLTPDLVRRGATIKDIFLANSHIALVVLTSELVILSALAVISMRNEGGTPAQWLASKFGLGWGIFGSVNLITLAVGHYALRTADRSLLQNMQYVVIGSYVLMMVLWISALLLYKTAPATPATTSESATA